MIDQPLIGYQGPAHEPCCGPTAISIVTRRPFDEVFAHIKGTWRKSANWRGGTSIDEIVETLRDMGASVANVKRYYRVGRMSFSSWLKWIAKPDTTYLIVVTGHAIAYRNGYFADQHKPEWRSVYSESIIRKYLWFVIELA